MCADIVDLQHQAGWDGASGTSRRQLLVNLQRQCSVHCFPLGYDSHIVQVTFHPLS